MDGSNSVRANLAWGLACGAFMALFFTALALVGFTLDGSLRWSRDGDTLAALVACYWVAGLGGGAIVGALRLYARGPVGASLVGAVVGFLVMLTFAAGSLGLREIAGRAPWYAGLFFGVPFGAIGGWTTWRRSRG